MITLPLFTHIAKGVFSGTFIKLVQYHQFGVIEHVNFFKLALRSKFRGHDIAGEIDHIDDFRIGLADTGSFNDKQFKTSGFQETDSVLQHGTGGQVLTTCRH